MSDQATLTKDQQGKLWAELKRMWGVLKDQSAEAPQKDNAKARINQIQKDLSLDITDFTKPFVPKTQGTEQTTIPSTATASVGVSIVVSSPQVIKESIIPNGRGTLQDFIDVAFPIAFNKALEQNPQGSPKELQIATYAILKPLGMVYGSLVHK